MQVIEQFPITPGPLVQVCTGEDDSTRRSFSVPIFTRPVPVLVADPALPNMNWFPTAKLEVIGRQVKQATGDLTMVTIDDELPHAAFWLTQAQTANGSTTPVDVEWQLRCSSGCTSEVIDFGTVHLKNINQNGIIVQAWNWSGNGYELWMRVNSLVAGAQVMKLDITIRASRFRGGGPAGSSKGSVSI